MLTVSIGREAPRDEPFMPEPDPEVKYNDHMQIMRKTDSE
jgi:hypothetical protein